MINKSKKLQKIKAKMASDKKLPLRNVANPVFGKGNSSASILFIGEAPGATEDKLMEPFVGRAGKLLDKMLKKIKLTREDVYITNIVKRRPPENRDPLPHEIEAYKPYLKLELQIIKPKIIATLGRFAMNYFLPESKISESHGRIFRIKDVLIYPLYHPAAAMRGTKVMKIFEKDFKKIPKIVQNHRAIISKLKS